jgi:hypothetical protein
MPRIARFATGLLAAQLLQGLISCAWAAGPPLLLRGGSQQPASVSFGDITGFIGGV